MQIVIDDLSGSAIAEFLQEHIEDMRSISPPESKHALAIDELKSADITFWSMWDKKTLVGCAALKRLSAIQAEIKSMRTSRQRRGEGIAAMLLDHLIEQALDQGYECLCLETGSMPFFLPARRLYQRFGFHECEPFADYVYDENSVYMQLSLKPAIVRSPNGSENI